MRESIKYILSAFIATTVLSARSVSAITVDFTNPGGIIEDETSTDFNFDVKDVPPITENVELKIENLTHPNLFELEFFLISPDQKVLTLAQALIGDQMIDTVLADQGLTNIDVADPPYSGVFAPSGKGGLAQDSNISSFADYDGINPNGNWTLRIYDTIPGNEGNLSNTTLTISAVPEPLTILGTGIALGFGTLFKREMSKKNKRFKI